MYEQGQCYQYQLIMQKQALKKSQTISESDADSSTLSQRFKATILKGWIPIPTLPKTIALFFILSAVFVGIGIPMMIMSSEIIEVRMRYDDSCSINTYCNLTFQVTQTMYAPIFVYYELKGFYQNHRNYASSINNDQMLGNSPIMSEISTNCQPIVYNSDLYVKNAIDGTPLQPTSIANPCGLIAYSIFNDTFSIFYPNGTNISQMTTNGIVWAAYQSIYKVTNVSQQWLNVTDPRFINWMRIAPISGFRKVWARINNNLESGNYTVEINNIYSVSQFGTNKYFVLSTSNFFGTKNPFLSISYLIFGGLCFLAGVFFSIRCVKKRKSQK